MADEKKYKIWLRRSDTHDKIIDENIWVGNTPNDGYSKCSSGKILGEEYSYVEFTWNELLEAIGEEDEKPTPDTSVTTNVIFYLSKDTNDDTDYTFNVKLKSDNWVGQTIKNNTGSTNKTSKTLTFNVPVIYTGDTFSFNIVHLTSTKSFDRLSFGGPQTKSFSVTSIDQLNSMVEDYTFGEINYITFKVIKDYTVTIESYINVELNCDPGKHYWHNYNIISNTFTVGQIQNTESGIYTGTSKVTYSSGIDLSKEETFYIGGGIGDGGNYKYYKIRITDKDGNVVFDDSAEKLYHTTPTKTGVKMQLSQFLHSTWYMRDVTKE